MALNYANMSRHEFDAIVTGELSSLTLSFELQINEIIIGYFLQGARRKDDFRIVFFYRECMTFQQKMDIVKVIINTNPSRLDKTESNKILKMIESFKSLRNALAHCFTHSLDQGNELRICLDMFSRSGRYKVIEITPESHDQLMMDFEGQFKQIVEWRKKSIKSLNRK